MCFLQLPALSLAIVIYGGVYDPALFSNLVGMETIWARLEKWLQGNAPHLIEKLNAGAQQVDIDKAEQFIGKKLPEDLVAFYTLHNGQSGYDEGNWEGLINAELLLPLSDIIAESQTWLGLLNDGTFKDENGPFTSEPDKGVKNNWWNPLWVPFTYDGNGNHICIDLDPAAEGTYGQVIRMWHDSEMRELYAPSFSVFMEEYVAGLESGKYIYVEHVGLLDKELDV